MPARSRARTADVRLLPTALRGALSGALSIALPVALSCATLGASSGCAPADEGPRWTHLAEGFRPAADPVGRGGPGSGAAPAGAGRARLRLAPALGGIWIDVEVPPERWVPGEEAGAGTGGVEGEWLLDRPLRTEFLNLVDETVRLAAGAREIPKVRPPRRSDGDDHPVGVFYLTPRRVHLRLAEGETPPPTVLSTFVSAGEEQSGAWRTAVGGTSGVGLTVWPGHAERVRCAIPPGSALRTRTAYARFEDLPADERAAVTFEVRLDGETVFSSSPGEAAEVGASHVIALPPAGRADAELEFRVTGDPGLAAFFDPTVGPAQVGSRGARPWGSTRPDVLVFLIDTFRADNLACYGGDPALAPALNDFAARSVRFENAYAPAGWTLPAQASMLCAAFPRQHGATDKGRTFGAELVTLAEHLSALGYRTGAVTDSGFIGRSYGFDQGFEWFDETDVSAWDLDRTFATSLEFLDRDDGRPTFLFVHTYRTHAPYRRGAQEDVAPWHALMAELEIDGPRWGHALENSPIIAKHAEAFRALYRDGVAGLDALFGPWVEGLEARGLFRNGYAFLTSDHGEAFAEHGDMLHGGLLWEEKVRVPILVKSDLLAPRDVPFGASLVDFGRTIAALTRAPAPASWVGTDLLALDRERPVFSFGEEIERLGSHLVVIEGGRKLHGPCDPAALAAGGYERAFDLRADPEERVDAKGAPWADELARDVRAALEVLCADPDAARDVELDAEARRKLAGIGYADGDEE